MASAIHCLTFLLMLALAATNGQTLPPDLEQIQGEIKNELFNQLNITNTDLPKQEDIEKLIREKCDKNGGGEDAFNALKNQQSAIQGCLEQYLNSTQIQIEVEEAKKSGSMDEVFGKYCKKYPEIHQCIDQVTEKVRPCLSEDENAALNKSLLIADELKEFICFKDGDRIAMFIAEGGVECLDSKKEELQKCANDTIGTRIPTNLSVNNMPSFLFSDRDCSDFDKIRTCFNGVLEKCKDTTPANIIDAFFKFLKKHMPCNNGTDGVKSALGSTEKEINSNSASSVAISTVLLVGPLLIFRNIS